MGLMIDTFRPYHLRILAALASWLLPAVAVGPLATLLALMAAVGWGSQRPVGPGRAGSLRMNWVR